MKSTSDHQLRNKVLRNEVAVYTQLLTENSDPATAARYLRLLNLATYELLHPEPGARERAVALRRDERLVEKELA